MMINKISSLTNPKLKKIVQLRNRKMRTELGVTLVEGERELSCAINENYEVLELYVSSSQLNERSFKAFLNYCQEKNIPVYELEKIAFQKISYGQKDHGLIAIVKSRYDSFDDIKIKSDNLFVVVENVEKPGNLGAMLRTCDGVGVDAVIICDGGTDIYNPNVVRASLGTVFSNKVIVSSNEEVYQYLTDHNVFMCITSPAAKRCYMEADLTSSVALVVGSEQDGLGPFWMKCTEDSVHIPMRGEADSLNVSVSAGIILYEAWRQRRAKEKK